MNYPGILLRPIALFRKEQVWMAEGHDLAIYNANKSIIQSLLEHSGIPESDHKLWIGIYRIGTKQDQARPAIVVSCLDPKIRRQAKGSIKSCSLFQQGGAFAHFAVLGKATPPELPCEPQLTVERYTQEQGLGFTASSLPYQPKENTNQGPEGDIQENTEGQIVLEVFGSHTEDNYLCRPIHARRGLQRQSATAGPLLLLDGSTYQLTVEHVVNFDRRESEPTWEHTNDDWDDDDDDDAGSYRHVDGMASSEVNTVRMMSEESLSSQDAEIDFSSSSSSSSAQKLEVNTSWPPVGPASTSHPQSFSKPSTVSHIAVKDYSSSRQIEFMSSPTPYHISEKLDYLLFPIHVNPDPELCKTGGAEMVGVSDVFDVHGQTRSRSVIITTAPLGYVRGTIFPAATLLQKPGSRSFQTLFCIESASPMPKGTSGSAVFDAQTGLLAGYLVLGCLGKCTCYMIPICDVLAELNMLCRSIVQCQVQLNVSAITEAQSETSNLKTKKSPPKPPRFSLSGGYIARLTRATLEWVSAPADEWKRRFGQRRIVIGSAETQPFIDIIRDIGYESSEIQMFCSQQIMVTRRSERAVSHIEQFCEGASFALDELNPNPMVEDVQEPTAWVSDQNHEFKGSSSLWPNHPRVLGCKELYLFLRRKRFPDDTYDATVGHYRRIYINNPNGSSVLALIRTTPISQVEGFHQLFTDYITPAPEPKIILRESENSGAGRYIFSFNLPFFGIQYREDLGNISSNRKRLFRCRCNLSFLNSNSRSSGNPRNDDSISPYPAFLQEAVWSFMLTGKSDRYWTAVFFDEDLFDDEPRLHIDEELLEDGEEIDPILQVEASATPSSPRSYALAALATTLYKIVDHHADILYWLKTSFDLHMSAIRQDPPAKISPRDIQEWMGKFKDVLERVTDSNSSLLRKLEHFLFEDVVLSNDALPRGRLWRSLQSDAHSLRSLMRIKECHTEFRDIEVGFRLLLERSEGRTRDYSLWNYPLRNYPFEEEKDPSSQRYVIAALVQLALILLLLKPFFQLRPEALSLSTLTELLIIVILSTTVVGGILYLRRAP